jgi:hypothetical protein
MTEEASERWHDLLGSLGAAIVDGPGVLEPQVRRSAARNDGVPAPFTPFVDTIHRHAYRITDDDVARLRADGADEDAVFEIVVASAYGAALERLRAGLRVVRQLEKAD